MIGRIINIETARTKWQLTLQDTTGTLEVEVSKMPDNDIPSKLAQIDTK